LLDLVNTTPTAYVVCGRIIKMVIVAAKYIVNVISDNEITITNITELREVYYGTE